MKINKEQYDALVAKLDALQRIYGDVFKRAQAGWDDYYQRKSEREAQLKAIEQGLDKLLQSHAALDKRFDVIEARLTEIGLDVGLHFRPAKAKQPEKRAKR